VAVRAPDGRTSPGRLEQAERAALTELGFGRTDLATLYAVLFKGQQPAPAPWSTDPTGAILPFPQGGVMPMAAKTKTRVETDGITAHARTTYRLDRRVSQHDAQAFVAAFRHTLRNASFEAKVRDLEADLQPIRRGAKRPRYGSRQWYAAAILETIRTVRQLRGLGSPASTDAAFAAAMRVGYLAAEWTAKGWPDLRLGLRTRAQQRQRSISGAATKRDIAVRARGDVRHQVAALRLKHPDASVRTIAMLLLPSDQRTDPKAIDRMRKRVERASRIN
jgi:hypothetical protein